MSLNKHQGLCTSLCKEIRLTTCVMLLGCVPRALHYLNLRSFSSSATAWTPSLPPLKCNIPEMLSICHLRNLAVSSMVHLSVAQKWIITNDNFLNLKSMSLKKIKTLNVEPFICEFYDMPLPSFEIYPSIRAKEKVKPSRMAGCWNNYRSNCLHVYLTFQPEGVKFLLELMHFLLYELSTKVCSLHHFPHTPSSSFIMPCLHLPADGSVHILLLLLNNHDRSWWETIS